MLIPYLMHVGRAKSERHHWWPECVSRNWADAQGGVNWLLPDGGERRARPDAFGVIGNGHFIKLGNEAGEATVGVTNVKAYVPRFTKETTSVLGTDPQPAPHILCSNAYAQGRSGQTRARYRPRYNVAC